MARAPKARTPKVPTPDFAVGPLSRRSFLVRVGGLAAAVAFGGQPRAAPSGGSYRPNVWVTIAADGTVTIVSPASEMGQGVMTTLPLLVAEEMDADWAKVRVVQAPADAGNYGNPGFRGEQQTGGSRTTPGYYEKLRLVGAQARKVVVASAAGMLDVPVEELATEAGRVVHAQSGRSLDYGDVAWDGRLPHPLPQATKADLKPAARWRLIGNPSVMRIDVPSKVDGSARFGIDVQLPDMLYGAVLRAPVQGEAPDAIDDAAAREVAGIVRIVPLPYGVGIVGETVWATKKAKELLQVTWTKTSRLRGYTSGTLLERYRGIARNLGQAGVTVHEEGDAPAAIAGAARVIAADYMSDHVYHAPIEPMNATALVTGDVVEVWAPTQSPSVTQCTAAQVAGTTPDKVAVTTTLLGGGFGRKAEADYIADAVALAKTVPGRPVKVIWSREDDVRHGKYRPLAAQHVQVGLDREGGIVGWRHRIVAQSIYARVLPSVFEGSGGKDGTVTDGLDFNYRVPEHLVEYVRQDDGQDVGFWRGVAHGYTKFAVECAIDEAAAASGADPLAFRLELLKDQPRARKVIETVGRMADWDRKRDGRALGLAYSDAFDVHTAQVAEVSLDRASGQIRVHAVWCAVDPGLAVQPLNVEAQMIGAITFGASHALFEQINLVDGEVQETNFDSYRVMRLSDVPDIEVAVVADPEYPPAGVGEAGLPPTGPAIANAVARLTGGVRLRHYPFLLERVKQALGAGRPGSVP